MATKRRLSKAGRERISAAAKARWKNYDKLTPAQKRKKLGGVREPKAKRK